MHKINVSFSWSERLAVRDAAQTSWPVGKEPRDRLSSGLTQHQPRRNL